MQNESRGKQSISPAIANTDSDRSSRFSPLRLFIIIIASIFFAEIIAMVVVYFISPLPYKMITLIDAGIMVILIFPVLYTFSFRPLIQHIEKLELAEKTLELLSNVVEQTADTVVITNCNGVIEYVNPAFEMLTEFQKEEALGQTPRVLKSGVHDAEFYKKLWDTVLNGQIFHSEITNRKKNGDVFHEVKTITPLRNAQGEITHFVATGKDITERRQAEEKLRTAYDDLELRVQDRTEELQIANSELEDEINVRVQAEKALQQSEQRLERAQEIAHLGSWELDLLKNQLTWSDEVYRIFGLEPQEFAATYEAFLDVVHPDDRAAVDEAYAGSIRDRRNSYEIVHRVVKRSNSEVRIVHEKCEHFGNEAGEIIRSIGMVHDITERKQAEEALQKSEAMLRAVLNQMPSGVTVRDASTGELILSNPRSREILGDLVDTTNHLSEYGGLHPDGSLYRNDEWPLYRSIATGEHVDSEEIEFKRGDGIRTAISISSAPIQNAYGRIVSGVSVFHDITERKRTEEKLRQLNRTLRALSNTNQVMIRSTSEKQYLDDVCKIVVEDCGHSMVWIGYAQADEEKSVQPVASAGFEAGYLETLNVSWADNERGRGPTGSAIRTGKASRCNNMLIDPQFAPWREQAIQRGYASSLVFPLLAEGKPFGAISIYSPEPDSFTKDEEALLLELSGDLAYGIQAIRLQEAHTIAEAELRSARDELEIRVRERTEELAAANRELSAEIAERREIERQLRIQTAAMEAAANGIIITDPKGVMLWTNPAITQISGYSERDLVGQSTRVFSSGRHDSAFYHKMWETILSGRVWHGETTNRRKDGALYVEEQTITPVCNDDGQLSHFIAIKQDVTERKLIHAQLEESNRELTAITTSERQQRFLAEGLVESSMALNMSLELHAVLDHIFEQTRNTIPYMMADVVLIEEEVATVVRQWGLEDRFETRTVFEKDSLKLQEFPIWEKICLTKSTIMIPDAQLENRWSTYFGMTWIRSYLGAPLTYNDQVIGIINLISDQPNAFQEDMARNLRAFAAPAAVAIQNARLYEEEQQNRKIAEILSAASVALAQTLDIQMVMETILDYIQFVMPLDIAFVILSEGDEMYKIRAVRSGDGNDACHESLHGQTIDMLSDPLIRSYITKRESTFIPDSREVSDWNPPFELASLNCWLGIPLESMGNILGMVVVAHVRPHSFDKGQIKLAEAVVKQAVVALQNAWLFEQVRSGRERLQQLSRHLVEIQENERKYIARELHDETSQSLTSLKLGLQVIEQKAAGHQQLLDQVASLKTLADETLESLHHLAVNLRPASLDHLELVDALTGLTQSTQQRSGLTAHFKAMGSMQAELLTEEMESSIYRIVQESITNVVRHAHATYVDVILEWQAEKIVIIIEDDGVGIDMQRAREAGHLGLIGMRERAEMLGGKLLVDTTPQVGTTLVVEIPYANSNTYSR